LPRRSPFSFYLAEGSPFSLHNETRILFNPIGVPLSAFFFRLVLASSPSHKVLPFRTVPSPPRRFPPPWRLSSIWRPVQPGSTGPCWICLPFFQIHGFFFFSPLSTKFVYDEAHSFYAPAFFPTVTQRISFSRTVGVDLPFCPRKHSAPILGLSLHICWRVRSLTSLCLSCLPISLFSLSTAVETIFLRPGLTP